MTNPVSAVESTGIHTGSTLERTPKQTMDSEVFLSLLVTQLRNQDPSAPMDTNAMISQSAQLASMEQMTKLTTIGEENFSLQMRIAASALIGQEVSYDGPDGDTITAVAESVSFRGSVPVVTVGGHQIPLDHIAGIAAAS